MKIVSSSFLITIVNGDDIPKNYANEFAFVGRSNVGKSSLINALLNRKNLAFTSKTAGLTKNINYFNVVTEDKAFHLVDLPGYGFHKRGKQDTTRWAELIERYLRTSPNLKQVFLLVDANIPPMQSDIEMKEYLKYFNIDFCIVLTKADKLSKSAQNMAKNNFKKAFNNDNIQLVSAINKNGLNGILSLIKQKIK